MSPPGAARSGRDVPVPATLDDLTAAWLSVALERPVEGLVVEPFGEGVGFLGDIARLHLDYGSGHGGEAPSTMVAKLPTQDPGGLAVGRMLSAWARESRFFADLAPRCPARVPACYYNGADPAAGRWALLLEDCGPGLPTDQVRGATLEQATAAVVELGRFHANWFDQPRAAEWLPGFDRGPLSGLQDVVEHAVPTFVTRYGDRVPGPTVDWLRRFAPRLAAWSDGEARHPLTVVHADYRLDNLIFAEDGTMTILDWQTALVGQGAMDLASFLATSLSVEHRRAWEKELVAQYAAEVGASTAEVFERVRSHLLWWMALYANNLSQIEPGDERGRSLFEQMVVGTYTAAVDHEVGDLLDALS